MSRLRWPRPVPWMGRRGSRDGRRLHAVKVATAATAVVAAVAVVIVIVLNQVVVHRFVQGVDRRLSERLIDTRARATIGPGLSSTFSQPPRHGEDVDDAPTFVWQVDASGASTPLTSGAPSLPNLAWGTAPTSEVVGGSTFRLLAVRSGSGWLVAGESIRQIRRVTDELLLTEGLFGALLLVATFTGSLIVGLRASAPIEQVRRRQAEFTADASHELRTPLSVIEAEVDLALSRSRGTASYEATLRRVSAESARLRSIVDDLLWLARADGERPLSSSEGTVQVDDVAESCTARFRAVADAGGVTLTFNRDGAERLTVRARSESIERLISVLLDNACRYAGTGGAVDVRVGLSGNRVVLTVDDSGPGIPEEHRELVFDRFHRATDTPGGTGLGLAIADAVVRTTNGTWSVGKGPLGGARMGVSWRLAPVHPSRDRERSSGTQSGTVATRTDEGAPSAADDPPAGDGNGAGSTVDRTHLA